MTNSNTITQEDLNNLVAESEINYMVTFDKMTICAIQLPSEFVVVGMSACVDEANFDKELGEKYALEDATNKLWELEGYRLAEAIHASKQQPQPTFIERMEDEYAQLTDKRDKLVSFISKGQPDNIDDDSWELLKKQQTQMSDYAKTLKKRIVLAKRTEEKDK